MTPSKQEIITAVDNLKVALLEKYEADQAVEESFVRKQRAHNEVLLARDAIRFN